MLQKRNEIKNELCSVTDKQIKKSKELKEVKNVEKIFNNGTNDSFVFSFGLAATLSEADTQKLTGTVMSVNVETGEVIVKHAAGEMKTLMADPKGGAVDIKMLKEGDPVSVECDSDGVINSFKCRRKP